MKVDIVELVENDMVELNVAHIGLYWGWDGVEGDYGSGDEGDYGDVSDAEITNIPTPLHPAPHPPPHTPPNQSKPIAQSIFPHL